MEHLLPWFPALTTTALLAFALWLGRNLISTRLTKSVEFEFNERLEALKADMRASEERLKAELREKEAEITALRGGALAVLSSRQVALDKRRLEAVDQLWSAYSALAPARLVSTYMSVIKFDAARKEAEQNPNARALFAAMGGDLDIKKLELSGAAKARPFVTPMVWAVYSAIQAITFNAVLRWHVLKEGMAVGDMADHESIKKLILTVLPHYAEYLEKHGPDAYHYCLEPLDEKLLQEINKMLSGSDIDKESLKQAAEILRQADFIRVQDEKSAAA